MISRDISHDDRSYLSRKLFPATSTRLATFFNGRKHKSLETIRKSADFSDLPPNFLSDVEMAVSGLSRVLSVEAGDDIAKVRLEMFGSRVTLPGRVSSRVIS